mgnify:CR=1 FL=1
MITLVARGMVDAFHEAWSLLKATYGPITESEAIDARFRKKGPQNWMTSFVNQDGRQTKRRGFYTPAFDKSRFIMDEYNLTGPSRTPMGTGGSTSDEDEEFLSDYKEQTEPKRPQMSDPQKHGLSQEQYDDWQRRLATMMPRGGSAAPN